MTLERTYWSAHTHSRYSRDDALSSLPALVARAVELGYPALGLTDHGWMPGAVELYKLCGTAGIAPLPGVELYITHDAMLDDRKSMHLTVLATTEQGYRNLVALHNTAWRQFRYRPRVDFADLARMAEDGALQGLAIGTGCRSGPVVRALTEVGPEAAEQVALALAQWFPRAYVEVMSHHFAADGMHDEQITDELYAIAQRNGLPMIVTGDAHYTLSEEQQLHNAFKELVTRSRDPEDGQFNGHGYHLLSRDDLSHIPPPILAAGLEGLADLAAAAKVRIPEVDTFSLKIPDVTFKKTEADVLQDRVGRALACQPLTSPTARKRYEARMLEELGTITDTGMAGYILLIHDICSWMNEQGIWYRTRGSASGSLVCWLLGITQEDPILWDIRMDRFLSGDRTSPPDVDLDIEHTRRDEVVQWLRKSYPVLQVGTRMHYGLDDEEDQKGSLRVKYYSTLAKTGVDTSEMPWSKVSAEHKAVLQQLADKKLVASVGAHPGGYIVASDWPTVGALPMVQIGSSGTYVTAYDKDEVGDLGFPKIDLLGSKALTAWRICCQMVFPDDPLGAFNQIPDDDRDTLKRVRSGRTGGMFQLEGWANRSGCEELKPTKTRDIVAIQALYRPAAMSSGFKDSYIRRRNKEEPIAEQHADIAAETKETYGIAVYQEQVVGVLRRIGMAPKDLTKMLKAVKSSGKAGEEAAKKAVHEQLPAILDLARKRGWVEADVAWLSHALTQYGAGYSFNKGHSVAYGMGAYRSAFLAQHYPLAFWTGMLRAYAGSTKGQGRRKVNLEDLYAREAREDGVRVANPHVSRSELVYTADSQAFSILKPLNSVKDVGITAAEELIDKRPFESLVDLSLRVTGKVSGAEPLRWGTPASECVGVIAALAKAGALTGIPAGTPMRKAKGRIRKCKPCKVTFSTPLEYEDHLEEVEHAVEADQPATTGA